MENKRYRYEKQFNDKYLTGSELMYAIGDAIANGEGAEVFQYYTCTGKWWEAQSWSYLIAQDKTTWIRRKPRMLFLTDMHGNRHEWPEPVKTKPEIGETVYFPGIGYPCVQEATYRPENNELYELFYQWQLFRSEDAARMMRKALTTASRQRG